ncbi:MAG: M16 family metallopeptidase [Candidatus Neomarinimicrobiota bacterium]
MSFKKYLLIIIILLFTTNCSNDSQELSIDYEKYTLDNGLKVILHKDSSDPLVAISTIVHVGSNREKPGKTGFAHFFEHMAFTASENTPRGANRLLIPTWGGSRNGGTSFDYTIYYEIVPKDALEKLMWIDSDRLGFMINTVDAETLEGEIQVVKNEKRQRVDNQPYGHSSGIIQKALYPQGHPYSWSVIGELEDLQAATIEDVKEFYNEFYGPSNATVVIAGDIDFDETKQLVERWFGEIKPNENVIEKPEVRLVTLSETKKLYHLDKYAQLPQLSLTFPSVEQYSKDSYALNTLGEILSDGRNSVFYKEIIEKQKLAPAANAYNYSAEIAGQFQITVRANPSTPLNDVHDAIMKALENFEQNGVSDNDLKRIKAGQETGFYNSISTNLNKARQLGFYNEYAGDPGFVSQDIANILAVTEEDVMRVYNKYIKDQHAVILSVVPQSQPELILDNSEEAFIKEEQVVRGKEKQFDMKYGQENKPFIKTETEYDRSEPALGELPLLTIPTVWTNDLSNGTKLYGIENSELPLVQFYLRIDGGQLLDKEGKKGTASLVANLMNEGTKTKTPAELEEAVDLLGSSISISAGLESISISGNSLSRNLEKTLDLVNEILTEPRWDNEAFEIAKTRRLASIQQVKGSPQSLAFNALNKRLYGDSHPSATPLGGTAESVESITMTDLKNYFSANISPQVAHFHIVGDINEKEAVNMLNNFNKKWNGDSVEMPTVAMVEAPSKPIVYFIDIPDAKQSAITVGTLTIPGTDPLLYPLNVTNNRLGGGMEARLMRTLRLEKGYTYGAGSFLRPNKFQTPFYAYSQVRTNVTLESLEIFRDLITNYSSTYFQNDLDVTKNKLIKSNALRFETLGSLLDMLDNISKYNLPIDYIANQQDVLTEMTVENVQQLANDYLNGQNMIYVVAGDANTQLELIEKLGFGKPILLDRDGNRL